MHASNFSLTQYYRRIAYGGDSKANAQTLIELMRHQLLTVPFENLDVRAGRVVSLVPEEIVEKIIGRKRGGYCYEVNGLFAMALEALGIEYQFIAARPMFYPIKRPKTHMAIIAKADGKQWLCDLGFGSYGIRMPLDLGECDKPIAQGHDVFMLEVSGAGEYLLKAWIDEAWVSQYAFDVHPWEWIDFVPANYLNSTHPDSIFVQKRLLIIQDVTGRTILLDNNLKTFQSGTEKTNIQLREDQIQDAIKDNFNLDWKSH